MNFFRSSASQKQTPEQFYFGVTENLVKYDNKQIYDIVTDIVNLAYENIELKSRDNDNTLDSNLKNNLLNARNLLKNTNTRGGKKVKRKTRSKTKKAKK